MSPTSDWTSVVSAISLAATAVILLVAGFIAGFQVLEARRLRHAQTRPFIVVYLDAMARKHFIVIRIENVGVTMARNVRLTFTPELASALDVAGEEKTRIADASFIRDGIPFMPPRDRIAFAYDTWVKHRPDQFPDSHRVEVSYQGEGGRCYRETMVLDIGAYRGLVPAMGATLDDMHRELVRIRETLDGWSAPGGGLLVAGHEQPNDEDDPGLAREAETTMTRSASSSSQPANAIRRAVAR